MSAEAPPGAPSSANQAETPGSTGPREISALVLIALACLLVLLGTIGVLYDGNLLWVKRLAHPFLFGCVAAWAFGVGVCRLLSTQWLRVLVAIVSIAVGGGWFCIGFLYTMLFGGSVLPVASADAPAGREYKAVAYERPDMIDTVWYVYIRQTRGLGSREWQAGCISNDATADSGIQDITWQSPNHLFVSTGGAFLDVYVDPRTGKPRSTTPTATQRMC